MLDNIIKLAKQLVSCPSISPKDFGCQKILISRLKNVGFVIEKMNIGNTSNFFAWRGNGEKTFLFLGHTDVVPVGEEKKWFFSPFDLTMNNGMLFGRGIADMKGAIASMIIAIERFIEVYPNHKNKISFLITSDEESDGKNGIIKVVKKLIKRNEKIDYCIVGEPTSNKFLGDNIKNGRRGSLNCYLTVYGVQSHVAYAKSFFNPIHNVLPFLNKLLITVWDKGNEFFPETKIQIIKFESNNNVSNIVPEKCLVQFNFRFSNQLSDVIIKNRVLEMLHYYKIKYKIKWQTSGHPFLTKNGKLLETTVKVIESFNKITPKISTGGGTSDGRFIAKMKKKQEIIEFGLVNKTIHQINECVKTSDLLSLSIMYQNILEKLLI